MALKIKKSTTGLSNSVFIQKEDSETILIIMNVKISEEKFVEIQEAVLKILET